MSARRWRSPMVIALAAGVASVLLAFAPTVWHLLAARPGAAVPAQGTPWQVERPGPGASRVFGLGLPGSTLAEADRRWGEELSAAVMVPRDGPPVLEAYVERFDAGGLGGRLLLSFEAPPGLLARWQEALPAEPMASGRRHGLNAAARADLGAAALVGLGFIPAAQLDAEVLQARFGPPAARLGAGGRLEHWLYPERGLAVALDRDGRELLQYVAPGEFERRLAAPLQAAPAR